jgi:hypothetical protein
VVIFILLLPLSERQAGEAWEPSDKAVKVKGKGEVHPVTFHEDTGGVEV